MNPYVIREPEAKEILNSIITMLRSFDRPHINETEKERDVWLYLIKNELAKFYIALKNNKIIGIGGLFLFQNVGSIGYMGVLPGYRNQGVGAGIFQKLKQTAIDAGCKTINLYASKLGEPIYRKSGFQGEFSANMYLMPNISPKIPLMNKNLKIVSKSPDWLLDLDREAVGFDRSDYLKARISLGAKLIVIENEGYGLLSNIFNSVRLGPVIASNIEVAVDIIGEGISLGAKSMIIPKHPAFQNEIIRLIGLAEQGKPNLKMVYGEKIKRKINYLYAVGTYAKG
ncbi:MAG: GNAT family N-acetyltransferase [Candidatus Lokiarchaeota archaeon]|nr:GNAT family N-acetyltransferase [Candidatus Lokiarchaeota archaeon]